MRREILIRATDARDATDEALVERVVALINDAYRWSEAEQWIDGKERTDETEIADLMAVGSFLLAFRNDALAGAVKVVECAPGRAEFGMLATDPAILGEGIGRLLVDAAEDWARERGLPEMEIEIVRAAEPNDHKKRLHDWYTRLGYREHATYALEVRIPQLVPLQRQVCVSTVYRKSLRRISAA